MKTRSGLLTLAVVVLYALHQDIWFWRTARPLVFGFMPIGLFYHACFSVAAALLLDPDVEVTVAAAVGGVREDFPIE